MRPRDVICLRRCQHFRLDVAVICPLSVLAALGHLPQGEARECRDGNRFTTIRLSGGTRIEGSRKTVNGAYRYRYAPFLVPIYDALALPLGELSPQVTEEPCARGTSSACEGASIFRLDVAVICPLRPRCARPPLPQGEARMPGRKPFYDHPTFGRHAH